jgi:hypothetical protein
MFESSAKYLMNPHLKKQLINRLKIRIGQPICNDYNDYEHLVKLIIVFMTSFDSIGNKKLCYQTYFQLLDLFLDHKKLIHLNQLGYLQYLESVG